MRSHYLVCVPVLCIAAAGCNETVSGVRDLDGGNAVRDLAAPGSTDAAAPAPDLAQGNHIQNVFIILMENKQWSDVLGDTDAPYINNTLLAIGAHAENYHQPPGNHPSEPNYIWLEAGNNLGIADDNPPANNHQATTEHLVTLLDRAGVSWKSYQEGIDGKSCPLADNGQTNYAVRHNPMVFFDDVTNKMDASFQYCIDHVRPYSELATDLASGHVARYNFITPSLCHDMHGQGTGCLIPHIGDGDAWLQSEVPHILGSAVFKEAGALFLTWDECDQLELIKCDSPIGMIVVSPFAKAGYAGKVQYDHSSTLRTVEEIFGLNTLLRGAQVATDLRDLFTAFP